MPLATGFLDFPNKRCGVGPVFHLTGDIQADMDRIRAFYEPLGGKFPDKQGPVRLREEPSSAP